jgi:hypothetical protein
MTLRHIRGRSLIATPRTKIQAHVERLQRGEPAGRGLLASTWPIFFIPSTHYCCAPSFPSNAPLTLARVRKTRVPRIRPVLLEFALCCAQLTPQQRGCPCESRPFLRTLLHQFALLDILLQPNTLALLLLEPLSVRVCIYNIHILAGLVSAHRPCACSTSSLSYHSPSAYRKEAMDD